MVTGRDLVALLLTQDGDRYIFGVEVSASDSNPAAFDCSELIEWGAARLGVTPRVPDGSWLQARHAHGISIPEAIRTGGGLLFRFSSSPFLGGRPASAHVAVSQGNGRTIEARSSTHGVGQFSAVGRGWTHAGLLPGITYQEAPPPMDWKKPGDPVEDLEDVRRVHEWHGHKVLTPADIAYDENDPMHLDERMKIITARLLSELMTLS